MRTKPLTREALAFLAWLLPCPRAITETQGRDDCSDLVEGWQQITNSPRPEKWVYWTQGKYALVASAVRAVRCLLSARLAVHP